MKRGKTDHDAKRPNFASERIKGQPAQERDGRWGRGFAKPFRRFARALLSNGWKKVRRIFQALEAALFSVLPPSSDLRFSTSKLIPTVPTVAGRQPEILEGLST